MNIQFGYVFYELLLGKHGEYLMSEVSKFLIEEYDNTNHKINEINYKKTTKYWKKIHMFYEKGLMSFIF